MVDDINPDETPAATIDLTTDDADTALMTRDCRRHGQLDGYAQFYAHVVGLLAVMDQYEVPASDVVRSSDADWSSLTQTLLDLRDVTRRYVLDEHEHAVRWTLDHYDEMDYDRDD